MFQLNMYKYWMLVHQYLIEYFIYIRQAWSHFTLFPSIHPSIHPSFTYRKSQNAYIYIFSLLYRDQARRRQQAQRQRFNYLLNIYINLFSTVERVLIICGNSFQPVFSDEMDFGLLNVKLESLPRLKKKKKNHIGIISRIYRVKIIKNLSLPSMKYICVGFCSIFLTFWFFVLLN